MRRRDRRDARHEGYGPRSSRSRNSPVAGRGGRRDGAVIGLAVGDALRLRVQSLIAERATPKTAHCRIRLRASRGRHKRFGVALPRSPKLHEYGTVRAEFQHASNFGEVNDDRDTLALGVRFLLALRRVLEHALALCFVRRDARATMKLEQWRGRGLPLIASIVSPDVLRFRRPSSPSL
jgi:hypothetical protein